MQRRMGDEEENFSQQPDCASPHWPSIAIVQCTLQEVRTEFKFGQASLSGNSQEKLLPGFFQE